ncbi:restriction endonuclease subunit S [Campylobacter devanensis]|uniref:restriction endonuclease subunit S n=1 Tax=Campylobacter devanensis TaxID=3161138 RepID=UPI000A351C5E|nr:restriction endonuclease subunit S [Campylobacter sp. P0134]
MTRAMKDSGIEWIGEIPIDWSLNRTKNYFINHKDIAGEKSDEYERLALTLNGVIKRSKEDSTGLQPEAFDGYQILRENELVFKLIDLENISTSRVGLCPFENGIVSPAYIVLTPRNNINPKYSEYYFLSMWHREIFNHIGDNGVRSSLNVKDLLNAPITIPSMPEQQKIADFLDEKCSHIDSVLEKVRASIDEYKQLKQSVITQAVTKGIRPNRPMKDSGIEWIGEIPQDWKAATLKHYITWKSKKGCPDETVLSLYRDYGVIPKDSRDDNHNVTSIDTSDYKVVDVGDFVINKMKAWQGSMAISKYRGIISPAYHICTVNSTNIDLMYFHYLLRNKSYLPEYTRLSTGMRVGQWDLGFDDFKNIPFIIPPMNEQIEIVGYLESRCSEIDKLITKKEQLIAELETYKKSLIYEYVTGKKEVI